MQSTRKYKSNDAKTAATEQKWSKRFLLFMTAFWSLVVSVFLWATYSAQLCAAGTCGENFLCVILADGGYRCECMSGFDQNGNNCEDIDECMSSSSCTTGAACVNIPHSFYCQCESGFLDVNGDASECRDIDECHHGQVCPGMANCVNTPGSFHCPCQTGFVINNDTDACIDIDECSTETHQCDANAACSNSLGSYTCTCNEPEWNGNGRDCYYFDPCWSAPCALYSTCEVDFESPGHYRCPCQTPFVNDGIPHGECQCPLGYANINGECLDVNECDSSENECSPFSMCKNTIGSYQCKCISGFIGNGKQCDDLDECSYRVHSCNEQSICSNYDGYYECTCETGYIGDGYRRWGCKDEDECMMRTHDCDKESQRCFNTIGSYICRCNGPNFISYNDGCVDHNECVTNPCPVGYNCVNKNNGFDCVCAPGYRKLDGTCQDIDECVEDKNNCDRHSMCLNKLGGHDCICQAGFVKNERNKCVDDNECLYGMCTGDEEICKNTEGSYECVCEAGYIHRIWSDIKDTKYNHQFSSYRKSAAKIFTEAGCIDFDECQDEDLGDEPVCESEHEFCWNTPGSHSCHCMQGWKRVGNECVDVNQCEMDPCPEDNVCHNTEGYPGYECLCPDGYAEEFKIDKTLPFRKDDNMYVVCHDIDECLDTHVCSEERECQNTVGSYNCICTTGYNATGLECVDINECEQYGQCDPGYECKNTVGSFLCLCGNGYVMNQQHGHCLDLDECETKLHNCKATEVCVDSLGSYICRCAAGYVDNGLNTCVDNNECMSDTHQCDDNARCTNTEGSHLCECFIGYIGNGTVCVDDDECESGTHDCHEHADCLNRETSAGGIGWECQCKAGFETVGEYCIDYDECREDCWPDPKDLNSEDAFTKHQYTNGSDFQRLGF